MAVIFQKKQTWDYLRLLLLSAISFLVAAFCLAERGFFLFIVFVVTFLAPVLAIDKILILTDFGTADERYTLAIKNSNLNLES